MLGFGFKVSEKHWDLSWLRDSWSARMLEARSPQTERANAGQGRKRVATWGGTGGGRRLTCMYMCIHRCNYLFVYVCIHTFTLQKYAGMYACMYVCRHVGMHVSKSVSMDACMNICMYAHPHVGR